MTSQPFAFTGRAKLSAVVISYNRSAIIATCLRALAFADEIILVDKSSTDDTVLRAAGLVDRIITVPWSPTVEDTRVFAMTQCMHDWILFLDDDECLSPQAVMFIDDELRAPRADIYSLPLRHYILGVHDEGAYYWPEHHIRLFLRGTVGFTTRVHGGIVLLSDRRYTVPVDIGVCVHHLSHTDVAQWVEKTNRYTSRPDRVRKDDGGADLVAFAHSRINEWQMRGRPTGPDGYPVAVALLLSIYEIVDRLKVWEEERGLDGAARFQQLCREFEADYASLLGPLARPRRAGGATHAIFKTDVEVAAVASPLATPQATGIGNRLSEVRAAADEARRRLVEELAAATGLLQAAERAALANAQALALVERRLNAIETSTLWRATASLRAVGSRSPWLARRLSWALRRIHRAVTLKPRAGFGPTALRQSATTIPATPKPMIGAR